jgi:demethoxyubiquinone hydroxylase (CLK1/Coq7/Cat5 family)
MTIATISWPEASVYVALIGAVGLVVAVLIWSVFRTGQIAIRSESRHHEPLDELRRDVDELRARLERVDSTGNLGATSAREGQTVASRTTKADGTCNHFDWSRQ